MILRKLFRMPRRRRALNGNTLSRKRRLGVTARYWRSCEVLLLLLNSPNIRSDLFIFPDYFHIPPYRKLKLLLLFAYPIKFSYTITDIEKGKTETE